MSLFWKYKKFTVLFFCLSVLGTVNAQQVTVDGLNYYLYPDKHKAVIDNDNTWSGELDIPSEISYEGNDYVVKGMVYNAFVNCTELTKVKIPKTITYIANYNFGNGNNAITPYLLNPFIGCTALEAVEVDKDNTFMTSVEGVLYSKDSTMLYCYPAGIKSETFSVPQGVTWVGIYAFASNEYIVSVELPASVKTLYGAFRDCKKLESIMFPDNLTTLDAEMFQGCTSLKSIKIPFGIKTMDYCVFRNCTSLKSVSLPESLNSIGTSAFENCVSLRELDMPVSTTRIGASAFFGCKFSKLIIRGVLDERCLDEHLFEGMDTSTIIYTQASEVEKFQKIYKGKVYPLLPSGEPTGIREHDKPSPATETFDLLGRSMKDKSYKGVYIQKGKKVVK